ncbi:hypothetical protein CBD41_07035 [bacterium TMED181]|nr:FAD/NAD(P)-binding oxidoreductase [Planctomycetota bacterium]OUW43580.1 MAG: hypothetical protein CBD41_07035 [bacterium TMED181]
MEIFYVAGLTLIGVVLLEAAFGVFVSIRQAIARASFLKHKAEQLKVSVNKKSVASSVDHSGRWKGFRRFTVINKQMEAEDICSFYLSPVDGRQVCSFEPGQHIGFRFTVPGESKPTIRTYSLSAGVANDNVYRVSIKKVPAPPGTDFPPGKGSGYFHEELSTGSIIEVSAPNGKFYLDRADSRPAVLIAGGIGITPLLSMLETICSEGLQRTCHLFHAVRSHRDHAFADRLTELIQVRDHLHLHTFFSSPEDGVDLPEGARIGFLSAEAIQEIVGHLDVQVYICGPPPMMEALVPSLESAGIQSRDLKMEAFGPASVKKKKVATEDASGQATIDFGSQAIQWDGESSILEMAEENDIEIDSGCRSGSCGTCQVRLISGKVKYEEDPTADPDEGHCLTCVGIPDGDIKVEV